MRWGRVCPNGFLPIYSVDTADEAVRLLKLAALEGIAIQRGDSFFSIEQAKHQSIDTLHKLGEQLNKIYEEKKSYIKWNTGRKEKTIDCIPDPEEIEVREDSDYWELICDCGCIETYDDYIDEVCPNCSELALVNHIDKNGYLIEE